MENNSRRFIITINGEDYLIEQNDTSINVFTVYKEGVHEIGMNKDGEWIASGHRAGSVPIPLEKVGEKINNYLLV